jgi:hypothetical protein
MMELARRCELAGLNHISNSAHPGRKRGQIELFLERLASHDSASGAAPTLLAATSNKTASGTYYAPSGLFALVGDPVQIKAFPAIL